MPGIKPFEINYSPSNYGGNTSRSFGGGEIRELFTKMDFPAYTFFRTIVNPEAIKALEDHVATRKDMKSPWVIREKTRKEKEASRDPDFKDGLEFSPGLRNCYLSVLDTLARRELGNENYRSYPIVEMNSVHSLDVPRDSLNWPHIHLVGGKVDMDINPVDIVALLDSDEAYGILKQRWTTQSYNDWGEIETLKKLGFRSIVSDGGIWAVSRADLVSAIDFLAPFTLTHK